MVRKALVPCIPRVRSSAMAKGQHVDQQGGHDGERRCEPERMGEGVIRTKSLRSCLSPQTAHFLTVVNLQNDSPAPQINGQTKPMIKAMRVGSTKTGQ